MREAWFAKGLALLLLVIIPIQGTYPQTTNTPDSASAPAAAADETPTAQPASEASSAPGGHKNKKLVGAPDSAAPVGSQRGPIVREIAIDY